MKTHNTNSISIYGYAATILYICSGLLLGVHANVEPKLLVLPSQDVQRKPVGKPMIITCRPSVSDPNLVSDLQWKDSANNSIGPKPKIFIPKFDSKGHELPTVNGQELQPMYTESLPDGSLALMITSLTPRMEGKYYCTASYANMELLGTSVSIKTYVAITWINAPLKQNPILGEDYVVKCEVKADPHPSIDWLRNGDQIRTGNKYVIQADGLLIRNVEESDDGHYTCRAAVIETGELLERVIAVEVYIRPNITHLANPLEATEGKPFAANCTASGKPVPEISWIKDDKQQNVATADRFQVHSQTGLLTISSVSQDDYGTYTCIAKNDAGVVDQKTKLNVLVRPSIYELYKVTGVVQREIALTCRSKGRPAPTITFSRWGSNKEFVAGMQPDDNRIILEQIFDEEAGESTGTLRIVRTSTHDDGLYKCLASNKGATTEKIGHIAIEFPPNFDHMKELPPVFSWEERIANLSCLAMGIPNATIEWRWNDRPLRQNYDPNLEIVGHGPRSDLLVHPVSRQYYSVYKCIASNIHGTAEHDMQLKEARVPDVVAAASSKQITATSITFDIRGPPMEKGLPITAYSVQYKESRNPDWSTARNRTWSPDSPYIVEDLQPSTQYHFRFAAHNQVGMGLWAANTQGLTPTVSPPETPKILHLFANKEEKTAASPYSDRFELRWSIPADNGEPIDHYRIKYCPGYEEGENEKDCKEPQVHGDTQYDITELKSNTYYRIELYAHNKKGYSMPAYLKVKTSKVNVPVINGKCSAFMTNNWQHSYHIIIALMILYWSWSTNNSFPTTVSFSSSLYSSGLIAIKDYSSCKDKFSRTSLDNDDIINKNTNNNNNNNSNNNNIIDKQKYNSLIFAKSALSQKSFKNVHTQTVINLQDQRL